MIVVTDQITKSRNIGTSASSESFSAQFLELICTGLNIPIFGRLMSFRVSISQLGYCLVSYNMS